MIFDHRIIHSNEPKRECCHILDDIFNHPLQVYSSICARWGPNMSFARKNSDFFGIELITAGNAIFIQNQNRYHVRPGEVYLLRKQCTHLYQTGPAKFLHKRCVGIKGPLLEPLLLTTGLHECDHIVPLNPLKITGIFRTIHQIFHRKELARLPELSLLTYQLLIELGKTRQPVYPPPIRQAMNFMEAHLADPISAEQIARSTGLSLTHFNRLFRQHMNLSPIAWFIQKRMTRAQYLLEHTLMSIKEVALNVGYDEPLYFSAQFKKFCGISPKFYTDKYRRSHQYPPPAMENSGPCY